jgi:hypothetical protein
VDDDRDDDCDIDLDDVPPHFDVTLCDICQRRRWEGPRYNDDGHVEMLLCLVCEAEADRLALLYPDFGRKAGGV